MQFYGVFAQYLTSSAAAIAVVREERGEGSGRDGGEEPETKGGGSDREAERLKERSRKKKVSHPWREAL